MAKLRDAFSTPNLVALITGLLLFSLAPQQPIHERFSLLERVAPALILLLIVLYARNQKIRNWIIPIPLIVLLAIMTISIVQMPEFFIVKDLLAFALLTLFAIIAVSATGPRPAINGATIACLLLILTTLFYAMFIPQSAFEEYGQLKGAFYGSNSLALSLVLLGPALCVFIYQSRKTTYTLRATLLISVFGVIYFSTSRTSLVVYVVMLLTWGLFTLFKSNWKAGLAAFSATIIGLIFIGLNWVAVTAALGKSSDLSGRFPLWRAYIDAIFLKPIQGYGWHIRTTADMPLGDFIVQATGYPQINANNDFLNWWALTGVFGAVVALIAVLYLIFNGFKSKTNTGISTWIFLSGIVLLIGGLTELSSMHPDGWFILSLAFVASSTSLTNLTSTFKRTLVTGSLMI